MIGSVGVGCDCPTPPRGVEKDPVRGGRSYTNEGGVSKRTAPSLAGGGGFGVAKDERGPRTKCESPLITPSSAWHYFPS